MALITYFKKIIVFLLDFIRKIIFSLLYIYYNIKIFFYFVLYGAEGLGMVLQNLPQRFIISFIRKYGGEVGENSRVLPGVTFHNLGGKTPLKNLKIGKNVYIGRNVLIDLADQVILMDDTALGAGCQVWTHVGDYTYDFSDYHEKKGMVILKKGVLVWSGVILSPGVSIGEFTRVGAGAVVIKDLLPNKFYAGVPARLVSERGIQ